MVSRAARVREGAWHKGLGQGHLPLGIDFHIRATSMYMSVDQQRMNPDLTRCRHRA